MRTTEIDEREREREGEGERERESERKQNKRHTPGKKKNVHMKKQEKKNRVEEL
jgi:hypothetical protein